MSFDCVSEPKNRVFTIAPPFGPVKRIHRIKWISESRFSVREKRSEFLRFHAPHMLYEMQLNERADLRFYSLVI